MRPTRVRTNADFKSYGRLKVGGKTNHYDFGLERNYYVIGSRDVKTEVTNVHFGLSLPQNSVQIWYQGGFLKSVVSGNSIYIYYIRHKGWHVDELAVKCCYVVMFCRNLVPPQISLFPRFGNLCQNFWKNVETQN